MTGWFDSKERRVLVGVLWACLYTMAALFVATLVIGAVAIVGVL